jgi:DNA polymerase
LKAAWKPAADAKEWPRARLWKGLACENITQATANDLLRHSLRALEAEGLGVVLHVHDEIVIECVNEVAEHVAERLHDVMCSAPAWAKGFPLNAEVKIMERYGK